MTTSDASGSASSDRPVATLSDLLHLRSDILACLAYAPLKGAAATCRKQLALVLEKGLEISLPAHPTEALQRVFSARSFDDEGSWVWRAITQAIAWSQPCELSAAVQLAYAQAEQGLSMSQRSQARAPVLPLDAQRRQDPLQDEQKALKRAAEAQRREIVQIAEALRLEELSKEKARLLANAKEAFPKKALKALSAPTVSADAFNALAKQHLKLFEKPLTLAGAVKRFGMLTDVSALLKIALAAEKAALAKAKRIADKEAASIAEARQAKYAWERSLVPSFEMPAHLGITKTEYQKWLEAKRFTPARMREFYKWGKTLEMPLFDPKDLAAVTPAMIVQWRASDAAHTKANRQAGSRKGAAKATKTRSVKEAVKLHAYAEDFEEARAIRRNVTLLTGGTNSGKTHEAMEALAAAQSGVYLAPLRLLALENYERLRARGIPVSLMTGEERIYDPLAKHVCATVEMCDFAEPVDVAVIDETQMLGDSQRGWAWTAALLGVPAKEVYACGAAHASNAVKQLLAQTTDVVSERLFVRKTPLIVEKHAIDLSHVAIGDALIAFSRQEVLQFAALLRQRNFSVSVIYGALSPEVRRSQAQAFVDGKTQVVVATDAIGLGMNLPIKRIVFTAAQKYDGVCVRALMPSEVQQIAGRAGRYGLHDAGYVTAFGDADLSRVRNALQGTPPELEGPFSVMPTWSHTQKALRHMGTENVCQALEFFDRISFGGIYAKADLTGVIEKAKFANNWGLSARAVFALACAPADLGNDDDVAVLRQGVRALTKLECIGLPRSPVQLDGGIANSKTLALAESYSRQLALFAWLGCKFTGLVDMEGITEQRNALTLFINRALESHPGDFYKKRRKHYHWRDDAESEDYDD